MHYGVINVMGVCLTLLENSIRLGRRFEAVIDTILV